LTALVVETLGISAVTRQFHTVGKKRRSFLAMLFALGELRRLPMESYRQTGWSKIETLILVVIIAAVIWATSAPYRVAGSVQTGMTDAEAIAAVGRPPDKQEAVLSFCATGARWYGDCSAIAASQSVNFLLWKVGIDTWLVVGVGANDKVTVVVLGDT
jgi:hypothetical protein